MKYQFTDLVDIEKFRSMMQLFYQATGIPHGLIGTDNVILSAVGWQDVCMNFHRVDPRTQARCFESDHYIAQHLDDVPSVGYKCLNGMMDFAAPIIIEGEHLATMFLGQLLHEPPDMEFFRKQAQEFGFDEEAYLAAVRKIPVLSKEHVENIMAFYTELAQMLAASGLDRMHQKTAEEDLERLNQELTQRVQERTQELQDKNQELLSELAQRQRIQEALTDSRERMMGLMDSSPTGIGWSHLSGEIEYVNARFTELFGYTLSDIPTIGRWYLLAYPDEKYRQEVIEPWAVAVLQAKHAHTKPPTLEATVTCRNGELRHVLISLSWMGDHRLVNFSDMTEKWLENQRKQARNQVLELIAKGAPLERVLHAIVLEMQAEDSAIICSVLLLDQEGKHLLTGAAPGLPDFYNKAIHGVEIGPGVGSCGTAAYSHQRVIVEDIPTHPYWEPYKELAAKAGLGSCWSEPIVSSQGNVLGTFAIYHHAASSPDYSDLDKIAYAANLASIAIEHSRTQEELERQAHMDYLTGLNNRRYFIELAERELTRVLRYGGNVSVLMFDIDHFKLVNDTYGHKVGDAVIQELSRVCQDMLRDVDIPGRIGGEEFAIVLPETDSSKAREVAERLREAIASTNLTLENGYQLHFTISIGIDTLKDKDCDINTLLNRADHAMYDAKNSGRNRVCVYEGP